ncbi:GNAT family N-acetyltransferase [Microbacterium saccharophilum]|uniref:GNAT family N-acetyltransferase n=1 Tax=Microbacterium saccharophilum TaxID=1213358 RepID=A0A5C8I158_9MICO|nr:GNAT family N-acetyltransferase [Microbacterium saccharophilum]TXK11314.1 GNAT family N-acetyltransferase [Microbacterium saccharophilum]GEP48765.1 N-acetyltransferase [Microbacterium saccharophilum]
MFVFSSDVDRVDRALVHRWLSEESYWAKGRSRADQDAAMAASRNYGVYEEPTGRQVGYARLVTDGVFFGWLCDVFVDAAARGKGIGKMLVSGVLDDVTPRGPKRIVLATADAQGLYEQFGWAELSGEMTWMVRIRPDAEPAGDAPLA